MKRSTQLLALLVILTTVSAGCDWLGRDETPPEVEIERPAADATVGGMVTVEATAFDEAGVEEVEFYVDGQRLGASSEAPWTYEWNTLDVEEGSHQLSARARDAAGNEGESETVDIEVGRPLTFTFTNQLYTDIEIEVDGKRPRSISPGGSTTYYYEVNPGQVDYEAETYGQTSSGNRIGLRIVWRNRTIGVEGRRTRTVNLTLSDDFFFLYMRDDGGVDLNPLYVNYGRSAQTRDNIIIPADGTRYRIGYYRAYTDTQVRAYHRNGGGRYTYWNQGTHFDLPFTRNQSVTLVANPEKSKGIAGYGTDASYVAPVDAASAGLVMEATDVSHVADREGDDDVGEAVQ